MKIDNGQTNFDPRVRAPQTDSVPQGHARTSATPAAGADTVNVSNAVQFASRAISASQASPDVRPEVVARAKQLVADGKVGNDPQRLADKIIDHLLVDDIA